MSSVAAYPHISVDASGVARIANSCYKVLHLAREHHGGWSAEEILRQHPDLRPEEVYAALAYFYDHYDEMVKRLQENADLVAKMRNDSQQPTREELLKRKRETESS